jgi:hypothetical protein
MNITMSICNIDYCKFHTYFHETDLQQKFVHDWTVGVDEVHISQWHLALVQESYELFHDDTDLLTATSFTHGH